MYKFLHSPESRAKETKAQRLTAETGVKLYSHKTKTFAAEALLL
jgi:hypothetical protein